MYVQPQTQRSCLTNLKWHQQHSPPMVGNASTAFPASFLSVSANLSNHFFRVPLSFGEEPPKSPMTESTIVVILVKRAESVEIIVIICSRIRIRILSAKELSSSRTFSRVCLILVTCVWGLFDSVRVFFRYSTRLIYPYLTVFVHQNKLDCFLLLSTF